MEGEISKSGWIFASGYWTNTETSIAEFIWQINRHLEAMEISISTTLVKTSTGYVKWIILVRHFRRLNYWSAFLWLFYKRGSVHRFFGEYLLRPLRRCPSCHTQMSLQQDKLPAHFSRTARQTANRLFPNRWIQGERPLPGQLAPLIWYLLTWRIGVKTYAARWVKMRC